MAKTPQTAATTDTGAPDTTSTAAPEAAAPASGERLATALCRIRRDGSAYEPGDPVPVDPAAFAELRAFEAVEAGAFDALPVAA